MDTINSIPSTKSNRIFKGFWIRLVATLIDLIILFLSLGAIIYLLLFSGLLELDAADIFGIIILVLIGFVIVIIVYRPIMEASNFQGTLGKYLLSMKVVDKKGQKIKITQSLIRSLMFMAQVAIPWLNLLTIWLLLFIGFTNQKQGLHDMAANTYVVSRYWEGPTHLDDSFGG